MRYAIIVAAGGSDEPLQELDGRTPLEAARTPNMDWIARHGRQGRVVTLPEDLRFDSAAALLSILGYDPRVSFTGRGPLEAAARGIRVDSKQLVFRCDLVTVVDGTLGDRTAGHISSVEADQIVADLNRHLGDETCHFHGGRSYRLLMLVPDLEETRPSCTPPHDVSGKAIGAHMPRGPRADWAKRLMERAQTLLSEHEVNVVRRDLGENPATDIWLWGWGRPTKLEPFGARFGISGAVVGAVDAVRGIARGVDLELLEVPGATGSLDTDYAAKGAAAATALDSFGLVLAHIHAPDAAGHLGDTQEKIAAIERVDEHVVGPVLEKLRAGAEWKILVTTGHQTSVARRVHTRASPPYCMAGHAVQTILNRPFGEQAAATGNLLIDPGFELMEYFLRP